MRVKKRPNSKMSDESGIVETKEYVANEEKSHEANDFLNICLLMFLYVMQGIPLGLGAAVPYILQSDANTASYQTQATFSIATWPFSLKLAWAPLVDSVYSSRIGRRKTWLIPIQYAIGIDLLVLAGHVDHWLGREPGNPWGPLGVTNPVDIVQLTAAFFGLTMLAATQDIVVDGWALTMLSKKNLGWASTCNSVGQTLGYVIAFILFLSLESPDICNTYLRRVPVEGRGLITFSGFLYFWGLAFLVTTTIVAVAKHESGSTLTLPILHCWERTSSKLNNSSAFRRLRTKFHPLRPRVRAPGSNHLVGDEQHSELTTLEFEEDGVGGAQRLRVLHGYNHVTDAAEAIESDTGMPNVIEVLPDEPTSRASDTDEQELSLIDTYRVMLGVLRLKPVLQYIGMLFLVKACFSASDSVTGLKLIERGVPKERMAFMGVILLPFQAVLPLLITRWTNGPTPLGVYSMAVIPRFFSAALTIPLVYYTPYFQQSITSSHPLNATLLHNATVTGHSQADLPVVTHTFSWTFYGIFLAHMGIYSVLANFMFVSQMAYHAKISDPVVGGTYMTLLNTAANLATSLPSTILLYLVDPLSIRDCVNADPLTAGMALMHSSSGNHTDLEQVKQLGLSWIAQNATCKPGSGMKACQIAGGDCVTRLDGFYLEVIVCILIGLVTFPTVMRPLAKRLDALPQSAYSFRLPSMARCDRRRSRRRSQNTMR